DTKNMFFKLNMTNPVVYELEFNHLTTGTVAVIMFVYLDGDTTAAGKVASGSRGAAVQANFKDVATVSHSGNQTTSFTFDAANYAGHYLKIQMQAQKSPKFTMSVKEAKPLLKYGENKIGITEAYSMFVDEYDFVPTETKSYSMTVPAGVEVLMNGEDFIVGEDRTVNFEGVADEKIVFAFKNTQAGAVTVTIGEAVEIPKITPDSPLTNLAFSARAATVVEVGDIEEGTYKLSVTIPNNIMRGGVICFGKGTSTDYNDYFAANGSYSDGAAEAYFQFPNTNTMNGATYEVSASVNTWNITLDLRKGDKLVFVNGALTNGGINVTMTKV
ncbi:MAG: hypothetical protein K2N50_04415, partial [Clostridia bacterium]|nr:hypothetical protein [Clostridia bacterium]